MRSPSCQSGGSRVKRDSGPQGPFFISDGSAAAPSDSQFGGRASYRSGTCVELIGSTVHKEFFAGILRILPELRNALENNGRKLCVGLFTVNSHLQYQMDYEWNDPGRWNITKLNGRSGLPDGLDGLPPLPANPRE